MQVVRWFNAGLRFPSVVTVLLLALAGSGCQERGSVNQQVLQPHGPSPATATRQGASATFPTWWRASTGFSCPTR